MKNKGRKIKQSFLNDADLQKLANLIHDTFETQTAHLATKTDLTNLATKQDLHDLKIELKQYTHEGIETIMAELDRIENELIQKEEMQKLKIWAAKVSEKVGIKL